ncbi:MAG: N-acetylmuramic acid 6-phosphate etherase [Planctomycetota bacterium]
MDELRDRGHLSTERRNEATARLHELSVSECVEIIGDEDLKVLEALRDGRSGLISLIQDAEPRFLRGGRLIYLGAGTSGRLGVLDASEAPPTFCVPQGRVIGIIAGGDGALRISSEGMEDDPDGAREELVRLGLTENDTVIGIAAGGTTPYPRGALRIAKELMPECLTGFLTCVTVEIPKHCDHMVMLPTGPEVLTGSTRMKAGTATKLALNTISTTLMIRAGRVYENLMVDVRATNDKLRDRAARIISQLTELSRNQAFEALDAAGGEVKVAIVMQRKRVDASEARALIERVSGRLGDILDGSTA